MDDRVAVIIDKFIKNPKKYFELDAEPVIEIVSSYDCSYSTIVVLEIVSGIFRKRVCVKLINNKHESQNDLPNIIKKEYFVLKQLNDSFNNYQNLSVVNAIACFPELQAIVTEEVPGVNFQIINSKSSRIYSSKSQIELLKKLWWQTGKWLQQFQLVTSSVKHKKLDLNNIFTYCDSKLKELSQYEDSNVDHIFRQKIIRYMEEKSREIEMQSNQVSGIHGDFSPHNMIINGSNIIVLDFGAFKYGSVYYDVCRAWQKLENIKQNPVFSNKTISSLQDSFLSAYSNDIDTANPLFALFQIRFRLPTMLTILQSPKNTYMRRVFNKRYYRYHLRWLQSQCV